MAKKAAPLLAYSPAAVHCPSCGQVMAPKERWDGMAPTRLVECTNVMVCELAGVVFEADLMPVELKRQ